MDKKKFAVVVLVCFTVIVSSAFICAGIAGLEAFKYLVDGAIVFPMALVCAFFALGVVMSMGGRGEQPEPDAPSTPPSESTDEVKQ